MPTLAHRWESKARGAAPGPRQGALPPGPPPEAEPLDSVVLGWGAAGGLSGLGVALPSAGSRRCGGATPRPLQSPRPRPNQRKSTPGARPWSAGLPGAGPLGGVRGRRPFFFPLGARQRNPARSGALRVEGGS